MLIVWVCVCEHILKTLNVCVCVCINVCVCVYIGTSSMQEGICCISGFNGGGDRSV